MKNYIKRKISNAFTLAELLITLSIIGLVTAICLPMFLESFDEELLAEQVRTSKMKFAKAAEIMTLSNMMTKYASTEIFFDVFDNYLQIGKRCKATDVEKCWDYSKVRLPDGTRYEIKKLTNGSEFGIDVAQNVNFNNPTVGFITVDGFHGIIAYNTLCKIRPQIYKWEVDSEGRPITSPATQCIAGIFDVDGNKPPNKLGEDVYLLNTTSIGPYIPDLDGTMPFTKSGSNYQANGIKFTNLTTLKGIAVGSSYTNGNSNCGRLQLSMNWNGGCQNWQDDTYAETVLDVCDGWDNMLTGSELSTIMTTFKNGAPGGVITANYVRNVFGSDASAAFRDKGFFGVWQKDIYNNSSSYYTRCTSSGCSVNSTASRKATDSTNKGIFAMCKAQ